MKSLAGILFLFIFTVVRIHHITADLVRVDANCARKIHSFLISQNNRCPNNCERIEDKMHFTMLFFLLEDWAEDSNAILREYIKYIFKAINGDATQLNFQTPRQFCGRYRKPEECITTFRNYEFNLNNNYNTLGRLYYNLSLNQMLPKYLEKYLNHVQESIIIYEDYNGSHYPEAYCRMKNCDNEIQEEMPICDDTYETYSLEYGSYIFRHVDYRNLTSEYSRNYVHHYYAALNLEQIAGDYLLSVEFYCKTSYVDEWIELCLNTFLENGLDYTNQSDVISNIFYNHTQMNTPTVTIEDEIENYTINFIYNYMRIISKKLEFNDAKLQKRFSPEQYCNYLIIEEL